MANTIEIVIKQTGQGNAIADASKALGGLGGSAKGIQGMLGGFASGLGNVATIAGGIVAANIFGKIADGITGFISTGLNAVGSSQQLETSLKSLLTANNMYSQSTETVTQAVTRQIMSQEELGFKHDELAAKLATQRAAYQEQQQRIIDLTAAYGENGLNVLKAKAQHEELALKIAETEREIAGLTATETAYTTTTQTAWQQTMDQADAFKIASAQTQDLLDFVSKLAVVSPFETETVELTTKYAIAAGLGVDATKEFVPAFLDLAGAVGITSDSLVFAADQLFQVKKIGKLTEIDLRQLRRLGIDLSKVIGVEMGMSVEEFNKKAETSPEIFDELFEAVTRFSQNTFAGTAKEMATSVKGLQSTFSDIFVIGSREFLRPLVDAATPAVAAIASTMSDFVLGGRMEALGQQAANLFTQGLSTIQSLINIGQTFGFDAALQTAIQMTRPILESAWANLIIYFSGLIDTYWPQVQAAFFTWRDNFFGWLNELYPQIPGILTGLVTTFSGLISEYWPTIAEALKEWSTQFWGWATEAAAAAGTALQAIGAALVAWATSGEAQASMNELGQNLGIMLFDALGLAAENTEGTSSVVASLVTGLTMAVAGAVGSLIILGGTIVAGILQGILEKVGLELEPATFNELSGILSRIGADIATIATYIGNQIVLGIAQGLLDTIATLQEAVGETVNGILQTFREQLGIASPSTVAFSFGVDLLQGFINGILSMGAGAIEAVGSILSNIFGGGEEATGPTFDTAAVTASMSAVAEAIAGTQLQFDAFVLSVANFTSITLTLLQEMFVAVATIMTAQATLVLLTGIQPLDLAIVNMYTITLPTLQAIAISTAAAIISAYIPVQGLIDSIIASVNTLAGAFAGMGAAAIKAGNDIQKGMDNAADAIEELIDIVKEAAEQFKGMAEAAREAANAAASAGSSSAAAGGLGFQSGTSPLGFLVPPGFPNDSFPLRVQSGERVLVAPRGQSIEGLVGGRQQITNYYFNQTVNTRADSSTVIGDFNVMRGMLGA